MAHYSNMFHADLQNLDLVLVPLDEHGCMIPEEFEKLLIMGRPALVIYAMDTTFKGGIDDQEALNAVLAKYFVGESYDKKDDKRRFAAMWSNLCYGISNRILGD